VASAAREVPFGRLNVALDAEQVEHDRQNFRQARKTNAQAAFLADSCG